MNTIYSGLLGYLVIYTGIQAAKEFGADQYLLGVIGAVVILSDMNPEHPFMNLLTGKALSSNQGGIIGVIFAIWLLLEVFSTTLVRFTNALSFSGIPEFKL